MSDNGNGNGKVNIHGKEYKTVALRVSEFRQEHPDWSIITEAIRIDDAAVVVKATIMDETGRIRSTGHGEEYRSATQINKTAALENCETGAIGRALAFVGFAGSEIASADELVSKLNSTSGPPQAKPAPKPAPQAENPVPPPEGMEWMNFKMTFGKHKGVELGKIEGGYFDWLAENWEPKGHPGDAEILAGIAARKAEKLVTDSAPDLPF